MASGERGSGRFGGESSGKSDVWKYFDKSADGKKAECKLCLQLYLKKGLSIATIDRLLGAVRNLVGHFHHSVVASEALKKWQEQMGNPQKKLVQDVATRWNSSLDMLESLLAARWPITAVLSGHHILQL